MPAKYIPLAIAYDFDGTLAPGDMPEHSFIPDIGMEPKEFWTEVKAHAKKHDMDEILSYMHLMLKKATAKDIKITKDSFIDRGKDIQFFPGVEHFFKRINEFGKTRGVKVSHYIISSGLREMIEGTKISKNFEYIFASGFMYDQNKVADWPALAVNYTNKTQYLFRINKGINNSYDNTKINSVMPERERPVPFTNLVYIGDGETDIPAMKMVKHQKGHSLAVYNPNKRGSKTKSLNLLKEDRADFAVAADYTNGKSIDNVIKAIIEKISADNNVNKLKQP